MNQQEYDISHRRGEKEGNKGAKAVIPLAPLSLHVISTNYKTGRGFEPPEVAEGVPAHDEGAANKMIFKVHLN